MVAADLPFVMRSWHVSYRDSQYAKAPSKDAYYDAQRAVIEQALKAGDTLVAHWPGEPDHLLGFVCGRGPVVHYVYVKQPYRRRRLGRSLFEHAVRDTREVYATHLLRVPASWLIGRRINFNPSLIFGGS